jgi:hypothetical protein
MSERGQLHDVSLEAGKPMFLSTTDFDCRSRLATSLAVAHVNFYIARNYMAHRDERDFEMAFGISDDQREADGAAALGAAMTCLVVCLALEPNMQRKEKVEEEQ